MDLAAEADGHCLKRTVPIKGGKHDPDGVIYIGEGGLGVPQRETDNTRWFVQEPGMATSGHHVFVIDFKKDGLRTRAIGMENEVIYDHLLQPKMVASLSEVFIPESVAVQALFVVGCVDIFTSMWIVIRPNLYLALWMGTWGLVTAMARITETGWMSFPEALIRAPHYLVPLAIVALFFLLKDKKGKQEESLETGIGAYS
ncbi:MAG TPA: hypothetical protein VK957_02235 [Lunatimonas sp.]|nr:hypothetical protein [Lunatimonas sp.]